jgi:hypothetical protein
MTYARHNDNFRTASINNETEPFSRQRGLIVLIMTVTLLTQACSSVATHMTRVASVPETPTIAEDIQVYDLGNEPGQSYRILGKVWCKNKAKSKSSAERIVGEMQEAAGALGADAIIGSYFSTQDNSRKSKGRMWGSGLAVKYIDDNQTTEVVERPDFIVAIPNGMSAQGEAEWRDGIVTQNELAIKEQREQYGEGRKANRFNPNYIQEISPADTAHKTYEKYVSGFMKKIDWSRDAAQFQLEKRGYYAIKSGFSAGGVDIEHLVSLEDNELDTLFGKSTEYILLLDVVSSGNTNAGFFASSSASLTAKLFSKTQKSIVWEGEGSSSTFTMGLMNNLFMGDRTDEATYSAMNKLMKDLPEVMSVPGLVLERASN